MFTDGTLIGSLTLLQNVLAGMEAHFHQENYKKKKNIKVMHDRNKNMQDSPNYESKFGLVMILSWARYLFIFLNLYCASNFLHFFSFPVANMLLRLHIDHLRGEQICRLFINIATGSARKQTSQLNSRCSLEASLLHFLLREVLCWTAVVTIARWHWKWEYSPQSKTSKWATFDFILCAAVNLTLLQ